MSKESPLRPVDYELSDLPEFPKEAFPGDLRGLPADHPLHPDHFLNPLDHNRAVLEAVRNFKFDRSLIAALIDPAPAPVLPDDFCDPTTDMPDDSGFRGGLLLKDAHRLDCLFGITTPESAADFRLRVVWQEILAYLMIATKVVSQNDLELEVFSLFNDGSPLVDEEGLRMEGRLAASGIDPLSWRRRILSVMADPDSPSSPPASGDDDRSGNPLGHQYARFAGLVPDFASMHLLNSPIEGQTFGPAMPDFADDPYGALELPEDPIVVMLVTNSGMRDLRDGPLGRFLPERFEQSIDERLSTNLADKSQEANARAMLEQAHPYVSAMRISRNVWAVTFRGMWRRDVDYSFDTGAASYRPDLTITAFARGYGWNGDGRPLSPNGMPRRHEERRFHYEDGPVMFDDERIEFSVPCPDGKLGSELISLFCTGPRVALSTQEPESALFNPTGCRPRKHALVTDHSARTGHFSMIRNAERGWDGYTLRGEKTPAGQTQKTLSEEIDLLLANLDRHGS